MKLFPVTTDFHVGQSAREKIGQEITDQEDLLPTNPKGISNQRKQPRRTCSVFIATVCSPTRSTEQLAHTSGVLRQRMSQSTALIAVREGGGGGER